MLIVTCRRVFLRVACLLPLLATSSTSAEPKPTPVFSPFRTPGGSSSRVYGDPNVAGEPFVVRIRELSGTIVPPHTHHFDENITVVQGTWYFGIGPRFDRASLHRLPAGSFVFIPKGVPMFGFAPAAVTVQVHGVGPFDQHFVDPLYTLTAAADADDSHGADPTKFRFRAGQTVHSPGGGGKVREGFATGELVQYILTAPDGRLFVAQEHSMRTAGRQ